mmetsp:Transcript_103686/g.184216  ORF Transcript_103686/g.184216 Transcript_103686/m.184216 type:complete len:253 (+) Transcript_103686:49-807(+)|eukprot:CAMPEP_0197664312 /NCGR_PEP_ID=MMETSP1338-20131121/58561_1 /TAXON_ID=43686 ORGANISM="Pelagodinium beii, Strain RCC1491" /NCGR_SAMPLE_ID=MMETSP1338 /ASSEMBLY_ACC=CAM_ASM_000754 /LENGTH=252 /DNA_ID=CAMNT_0043242925 /DNA_START=47 /DNA_END=805 /DNA_ORIENTATION=-
MPSKQADRNAQKRAAKKEAAAEADAAAEKSVQGVNLTEKLVELSKAMITGSCLLEHAPQLPALLQDSNPEKKQEIESQSKTIFAALGERLFWHNPLGLAEPATPEESKAKWLEIKGLEMDMGPRKKKRETGNPSLDRIMMNVCSYLPQYTLVVLVFAMLHAFLFRSFFACLPWLCLYQLASVLIPLETMEQVPQVPLSECPTKYRVAATIVLHGLMLLFFAYELLWMMNFLWKILLIGLIALHAHSVRPASA